MSQVYIGYWLSNLLIPGDPKSLILHTPAGTWEFRQGPRFSAMKQAVSTNGQCAHTYSVEGTATFTGSRAAAVDGLLDELLAICLGASYLTGLSVAPVQGLPHSEVQFIQVGPHFPRPRAMGRGHQLIANPTAFAGLLQRFVTNFPTLGVPEKARLLCHHWLDALAYWSLEDLVLSTGTILEIIAATAKSVAPTGTDVGNFTERLDYAALRFGLPVLPGDFRKMRNDLVHEGALSRSKFPNKDAQACGAAAAEALDWIDSYIFAALGLGSPPTARFAPHGFATANSFSLE